MLANDAADQAPRILPRVDSMGDILGKNRKRPYLLLTTRPWPALCLRGPCWGRDINGQATLVEDLPRSTPT
jgi:hypothetical protein